ncbi:YdaE family protein [Citrobacter braakii]|uniref:YdaE family protein n=1 Tax=Citrobacter braakii TaxID=57706 RepID=UPI0040390D6B
MKIKCAYHLCNKEVEEEEAVTEELHIFHGSNLKHEWREYCSKQCAEHDQMAHEL